jgi:threonine/homoserine/homoserine lactone efflux protein
MAFSSLSAVALVSLLAAISPGPDFCIVVRNSLSYSRKCGLLTAFGVSLALIVHLSYTLVGIGVLIEHERANKTNTCTSRYCSMVKLSRNC